VPKSLATCRQLAQQGIAAAERGQHQQAEALLAKAVKACPDDAEARRHYAESLWSRGACREAITQLKEATQLDTESAMLSVRLAEMYLATGQMEPARQRAEQALDLNPKLPGAWAIRGRVMHVAGQLEQALADYHRSLAYAPDNRQVLSNLAELCLQLNRPQRALATLHRLGNTYSPGEEPPAVLYLTGMAYMGLGRYQDGAESFSATANRGDRTPEVFYRLGEAQLLAGNPAEAAAAVHRALQIHPQHSPSRALLDRINLARQPSLLHATRYLRRHKTSSATPTPINITASPGSGTVVGWTAPTPVTSSTSIAGKPLGARIALGGGE